MNQISSADGQIVENAGIKVIDLTSPVIRIGRTGIVTSTFTETLGDAPLMAMTIERGDAIDVAVWEAPPAMLFGTSASLGGAGGASAGGTTGTTSQRTSIPEMTVGSDGRVQIPFAGAVMAAGRTPAQLEREIERRLDGKAHAPEVVVRLVRNASSTISVLGEVGSNTQVPLTARGERVLDVLASAGGVKQPTGKITLRIARDGQVSSMPLDSVIRDPAQNIRLQAGDVVTALYQPYSFTALGAAGTNKEVPFESTGLTLSQALGRMGGLNSERADARGVFIFRLEDPQALDPAFVATARRTPEGLIPVIYRADLKDPATFFIAQNFPIRDKDVIYGSSAKLTEVQRFVQMISSLVFPVIGLTQAIP
ncbi:MAG: polysaccharide export protein [Pseudomonadota bacterium]|nr:polysaccharide export protein [Pseudomonadota bacterium]